MAGSGEKKVPLILEVRASRAMNGGNHWGHVGAPRRWRSSRRSSTLWFFHNSPSSRSVVVLRRHVRRAARGLGADEPRAVPSPARLCPCVRNDQFSPLCASPSHSASPRCRTPPPLSWLPPGALRRALVRHRLHRPINPTGGSPPPCPSTCRGHEAVCRCRSRSPTAAAKWAHSGSAGKSRSRTCGATAPSLAPARPRIASAGPFLHQKVVQRNVT
jgi:hypothetical protein